MSVLIEHRFRGPNDSGNGGYSAGTVAAAFGRPLGPAEVTLRHPPPLDHPMAARTTASGLEVLDGDTLVAGVRASSLDLTMAAPVSIDEARAAQARCPWLVDHPYPQCFVCGTERSDGLQIFPGPVDGREVAAATWTPDATVCDEDGLVRPAVVWAAIDCPSLFGYGCFHEWGGLMLLGRFTAHVHRRPARGEPCVVTGWSLGRDGRKVDTAAALYSADGELLAASRALWILLKP